MYDRKKHIKQNVEQFIIGLEMKETLIVLH